MKTFFLLICISFSELIIAKSITPGPKKSEIVSEKGWDFYSFSENGIQSISYVSKENDKTLGDYTTLQTYYFDKNDVCTFYVSEVLKSDINKWVKHFDEKYVKIEELKWKDYTSGIVYSIQYSKTPYLIQLVMHF